MLLQQATGGCATSPSSSASAPSSAVNSSSPDTLHQSVSQAGMSKAETELWESKLLGQMKLKDEVVAAKEEKVVLLSSQLKEVQAQLALAQKNNSKYRADAEKYHGMYVECRADHQKMFDAMLQSMMRGMQQPEQPPSASFHSASAASAGPASAGMAPPPPIYPS